jgi:hypothetical protein
VFLLGLAIAGCSSGEQEKSETMADAAPAKDAAPPTDASSGQSEPCNGHVELCDRSYDSVTFPCTHNAHSAEEYGYPAINANQVHGFQQQLDDGIRCMLADVYESAGEHLFCHAACELASTKLVDGLSIWKKFLDGHPREILTIIFEDHMPVTDIVADFASTGLDKYVYTHEAGKPWPTLREMIDENTRLVITAEQGAPPPAWFQHVWDLAWDTPYTFASADQFSCALNRGKRENPLFLLNHWVQIGGALPDEEGAKTVNTESVLYARAKQCWDEAKTRPNFIAVDFYEHGDLFRVVDKLNGL